MRKQLGAGWSPLVLTFWVTLGVLPLYFLFWLLSAESVAASGYWWSACIGILLAACAAVLFVQALQLGDMAKLLPILALTPIVATITGGILLHESMSLTQWFAMLVAVIAVIGVQGGIGQVKVMPFTLMLIVACCWGVGIVLDKMALQHSGPMFHGVFQNIGVVGLLGLMIFKRRETLIQSSLIPLIPAVALFMLAVVGQWLALSGLDSGIVEIVKRSIGIIGALVLGRLFFQENVSLGQVLWCSVIVVALAVILNVRSS